MTTPIEAPSKQSRRLYQNTGYAILAATLLVALGILAILLAIFCEQILRSGPTITASNTSQTEQNDLHQVHRLPDRVVTGRFQVLTTHADREPMAQAVRDNIARTGGAVLEERDDGSIQLIGKAALVQAFQDYQDQRGEDGLREEHYLKLHQDITALSDNPAPQTQTVFVIEVKSPLFERDLFLNATVAGVLAVTAGVMVAIISLMILATSEVHTSRRKPAGATDATAQ